MPNFWKYQYMFPLSIALAGSLVAIALARYHSIRIPNPLHASCKIDWTFQANCGDINSAIGQQMKNWESDENCKNGGEKCLYKLISQTDAEIKGTHETPVKHYADDLTFSFTQNGNICNVHGFSTSETWYAVLDSGTNYCNLHNLMLGAGLDKTTGYSESTDNSRCTQYSSADCSKY